MSEISKTPVSDFDAAVRLLSGGTNVAIYNDLGLPSIYVKRDNGFISDVIKGGPHTIHYAFKVNGVEIPAFYMGKYLATVYKGRALSLPLQDPTAFNVATGDRGSAPNTNVNFDNAKIWCEANGAGFHLPTIAEYAWIALRSRRYATMPRGNNYFGTDVSCNFEAGVGSSYGVDGKINRTLTGSGPATWNDNWKPDGICDLNGNVYEWQSGYRTVDGELQIFADNDAAMQYNQNATSTLWKAILPDGTLVEPGSDGTLKWDFVKEPGTANAGIAFRLNNKLLYKQTSETPYGVTDLSALTAADGVNIPDRLKALALMPDGSDSSYGEDRVFMKNIGERFVCRGGYWQYDRPAGVFFAYGSNPRSYCQSYIGFRPAFIPGI